MASAKAKLEEVLERVEWLVDFPLRYLEAERWDSFKDSSNIKYRELMGDHNVVRLAKDETSGHLESLSTYVADQFGRYYLLRPLLHTDYCESCGQLTVFVLDGWDPVAEAADYKAMDHQHTVRLAEASSLRAVGLLPG